MYKNPKTHLNELKSLLPITSFHLCSVVCNACSCLRKLACTCLVVSCRVCVCVFVELVRVCLWMLLISSCRSWSRLIDEFQLCHCCIWKGRYSDIDILCCHSAGGVDILIKSPDILFPTVLWDIYVLWKKKALMLIFPCKVDRTRGKKHSGSFSEICLRLQNKTLELMLEH